MNNDNLDSIKAKYSDILKCNNQIDVDVASINKEVDKRIKVCDNTKQILNNATQEFNSLTSIINKKDISFFFLSVILQCTVKHTIKELREMSDKELAEKTPFHRDEKSKRQGEKYYATKKEIISNPVPFDSIQKEHSNQWYKESGNNLPGFSGFNHRVKALGHDPLLGLIFGTANIMTSTITRCDLVSWHVDTRFHSRIKRNGEEYFANLDTICERASTVEIFRSIVNRVQSEGKEGWVTLGCALLKEIVHLFSDLPSKQGLPLPITPVFSYDLAQKLSFYGLNTSTITQGGAATMLINWLIGFLHALCKSKDEDDKLYEVRTRKIIMYSDTLSTLSDIGFSIFKAYMGDKNTLRKFDLGGYIVTLYQICHSSNVIASIESEFYTKKIAKEFNNTI